MSQTDANKHSAPTPVDAELPGSFEDDRPDALVEADASDVSPRLDRHGQADEAVRITLPCVSCGYNLRGLSPSGVCPECGTDTAKTLAYVVDPARSQILPLRSGISLSVAIVLIPLCLLGAVVILWSPHVQFMLNHLRDPGAPGPRTSLPDWFGMLASLLGFVAFFITFLLNRPTGNGTARDYRFGLIAARLGLFGWSAMLLALAGYDMANHTRFASLYDHERIDMGRSLIRLALDVCAILAATSYPRVIRFLALRSLYHRVVQVSRQGFLAITVAICIVTAGDLLWILTSLLSRPVPVEEIRANAELIGRFSLVSAMLILVGSGMLTLALLNCFFDGIRLARHMNNPRYRRSDVVGPIR